MFRRPSRTLMQGIGVASAVLAGVVVAFSFAAGLLGFSFLSGEQHSGSAQAVRIQDRGAPAAPARPRARRQRPAPAVVVRGERAPKATPARRRPAKASAFVDEPAAPATPPPPPPPPPPARPQAPPPPAAAAPPPRAPLEPVGAGVNNATDGLAGAVRTLTEDLGEGVKPLSPELGEVLSNVGDVLADIVEGAGNVLGRALGHRQR